LGLIATKDTHKYPSWNWQELPLDKEAKKRSISQAVEAILLQAYFREADLLQENAGYPPSKNIATVAQWNTKTLRNDAFELFVDGDIDFATAKHVLLTILDNEGDIIDEKIVNDDGSSVDDIAQEIKQGHTYEIRAIMRSGLGNLVLAIVRVRRVTAEKTHVEIRGIAQETLIKHHVAKKVVRSMAQWLEAADETLARYASPVYEKNVDPNTSLAESIHLEKVTSLSDSELSYWQSKINGVRFLALSFGIMTAFVWTLLTIGLFVPSFFPNITSTQRMYLTSGGPIIYWLAFILEYGYWKCYAFFIKTYRINEEDFYLPATLKVGFAEIASLKTTQILFIFGLFYTVLLVIWWMLKG
jgi:hypothetical protein